MSKKLFLAIGLAIAIIFSFSDSYLLFSKFLFILWFIILAVLSLYEFSLSIIFVCYFERVLIKY